MTKNELARRLVAHDITLSPSQIKKTPIAKLEAMLADAQRAAEPIDPRVDRTYKTDPNERDDNGLLTEGACMSRAEDWKPGHKHGAPEAGGLSHDSARVLVTFTDMHQAMIDRTTGKVTKLGPIDAPSNVVAVDFKRPRKSKGINLEPKPADQIKVCRAGTVQAALIDALVGGATLWELQAAAPNWTASTIKSGLNYDVNKLKGYGIRTELLMPRQAYDAGHEAAVDNLLGTDQEHEPIIQVYHLVLPAGMDKHLPHVESAPLKMAANRK